MQNGDFHFLLSLTAVTRAGCWLRRDGITQGYWRFGKELAHRAMWEHVNGKLPEGETIYPVCEHKGCINFTHMRQDKEKPDDTPIYYTRLDETKLQERPRVHRRYVIDAEEFSEEIDEQYA